MATKRTKIGLADWIRVLQQFPDVTDVELENISQCLRVSTRALPSQDYLPKHVAWHTGFHKKPKLASKPLSPILNEPVSPAAPKIKPKHSHIPLPIKIEKLPELNILENLPQFSPSPDNLKPLQLSHTTGKSISRASLFPQRTARGIINELVVQPVKGGDLNVPQLINSVVNLEVIQEIPLLPRLSNQNGCQLLLDFSEHLVPWWDDMRDLSKQFHSLMGTISCQVYEFEGDPLKAMRWTESGEEKWKKVLNKPVVIATDFGQASINRASPRLAVAKWKKFALFCKKQQISVVILTPLARENCPKELEHWFTIVQWGPCISSADIKHLFARLKGKNL